MTTIPTIETARLRLRAHSLRDFDACHAMWSDENVIRFISGKPSTEEESWSRLLRTAGHWQMLGFGFWLIEDRQSGAFLGETGFLDYRRGIEPSLHGTMETGWVLHQAAQGKGYATEAVTAVLDWGHKTFGKMRSTCIIDPDNSASLRVAEKSGYREFAQTSYKDTPVILLERYLG